MSELPKRFFPLRLTKKELERLEAWIKREAWTRERTIKKQFGPLKDDSMPGNLVVPGVPPEHWSGKGKCICVMCGHTSTVTNICRQCPELPADAELTSPRFCPYHETVHMLGKKFVSHRSINMVAVS